VAHEADRWLGEARPSQPIIPGLNLSFGGGGSGQYQCPDGKGKGKEVLVPIGRTGEREERNVPPRPPSPLGEEQEDGEGPEEYEPPEPHSQINNREYGRRPKQKSS